MSWQDSWVLPQSWFSFWNHKAKDVMTGCSWALLKSWFHEKSWSQIYHDRIQLSASAIMIFTRNHTAKEVMMERSWTLPKSLLVFFRNHKAKDAMMECSWALPKSWFCQKKSWRQRSHDSTLKSATEIMLFFFFFRNHEDSNVMMGHTWALPKSWFYQKSY